MLVDIKTGIAFVIVTFLAATSLFTMFLGGYSDRNTYDDSLSKEQIQEKLSYAVELTWPG